MMVNNIDSDSFQEQVIKAVEIISFSENLDQSQVRAFSDGFEETKREAEEIVEKGNVKNIICEAIKSPVDDVVELAQQITPALVGAILAESILIPLNPIIFGWIALLIFKMGINAYCATR